MKHYAVDVDITMSKRIWLDAENEEQARKKAEQMINNEPYYYASHADTWCFSEVTDVIEEEEEND